MPAKTKKLILIVAIVAAVLVLGLLGVLFTDFDSPELGRLALNQIGRSADMNLEAESFRLNLLRGLELGQVKASGQRPDGELQASMDRLVLKHRPGDLLSGTLTVTEIVLEKPTVTVVSTAGAGGSAPESTQPAVDETPAGETSEATGDSGRSLDLAISSIRLTDGSMVSRSTTDGVTETTEVKGLDVALNDLTFGAEGASDADGTIRIDEIVIGNLESDDPAALTTAREIEIDLRQMAFDPVEFANVAGATLQGDLRIAEATSGGNQARDTSGRIELAGGQLKLEELELTAPQGVLQGRLEAGVAEEPMTYSLRLDGDALSTGVLLGLGDISGLGTSRFEFSASGNTVDDNALVGNGRLTIGNGSLPEHPVFRQLEAILGNAALVGAGYDSFPLEFDIREQRFHLAECELSTGPISFTLSGWLDFAGPLEMQLSVLTPREGLSIKEIPVEVLDVLAEEDGRVNLPMLVSGTADLSKVALNQRMLKQLGKRYAQKTVEKELTKALTGLFGRKKDDDG